MRDEYFKSFLFIAAVLWVGVLVFNLGSSPDLSGDSEKLNPSLESSLGVLLSPGRTATLSFVDLADNEEYFGLEKQTGMENFISLTTIPTNIVSAPYTVTTTDNVLNGNTYRWRVNACNVAGCSSYVTSNFLSVPEGAPTGLAISLDPINYGQANLGWTDNGDNEYAYQVERSNDGGVSYIVVTTINLPSNSVSYSDTGLSSGTYNYRVTALNGVVGDSLPSNIASVVVPIPPVNVPLAPTNLQANLV